jgi:hypothetical protein
MKGGMRNSVVLAFLAVIMSTPCNRKRDNNDIVFVYAIGVNNRSFSIKNACCSLQPLPITTPSLSVFIATNAHTPQTFPLFAFPVVFPSFPPL